MKQFYRLRFALANVRRAALENKRTVLILIMSVVIVDAIFNPGSTNAVFFGATLSALFSARVYRLASKHIFLFCMALFSIMGVRFVIDGASIMTEKAAVWLILFWIVGTIQMLGETHA